MKAVWLIVLICVAIRLATGSWPWQSRVAPGRKRELERARARLGLGPGAGRADIVEAHRRTLASVHPDRGGTSEQVHEVNAARDVLLGALAKAGQE